MTTNTMSFEQQSMSLARRRVVRLEPVGRKRYLQVLEGSVWLTLTATRGKASDDLYLGAGNGIELHPHDDAVIEGLEAARFQLVEPVSVLSGRASARGAWSLSALVRRLSLSPEPSACV